MRTTKAVCQHSRTLPNDTMDFLHGIAEDYAKVKNAVYDRYAGIRHIYRINSAFRIMTAMRSCGLRQQLNLPSVYYDLAVEEATQDIKGMWSALKNKIRGAVRENANLSDIDRMYINTITKFDKTFAEVLNRRDYKMPKNLVGMDVDKKRLNNLICRLVRRYITKPTSRDNQQFQIVCNGYRYADNGIYLVSRVPRSRIYIPLKDSLVSSRQLRVCVRKDSIDIYIPVDVEVKESEDYVNIIYVHIGNRDALTLSNGHVYGKDLDCLVNPETDRLHTRNIERSKMRMAYKRSVAEGDRDKAKRIEDNNLGRKKYDAQKKRIRARTQNYINTAINRMLTQEKPKRIIITRPVTRNRTKYYVREINRRMARSFTGYIRKRLEEKCRFCGVELISISSKDTRLVCSQCGAIGTCEGYEFKCSSCGYFDSSAKNSAVNIEKKAVSLGYSPSKTNYLHGLRI